MIKFDKTCKKSSLYYNYITAISGILPPLSERDKRVLAAYIELHTGLSDDNKNLNNSEIRNKAIFMSGVINNNISNIIRRLVRCNLMHRTIYGELLLNKKLIPRITNDKISIEINIKTND